MTLFDRTAFFRLLFIFTCAFVLNFAWEHLHSLLYTAYKGAPITDWILFRATLGDAIFLAALSVPFFRISWLHTRLWVVIPLGVACAIALELFALHTGRWEYNSLMPLVPLVGTGLTPTIQLGLLGYVSFLCARYLRLG